MANYEWGMPRYKAYTKFCPGCRKVFVGVEDEEESIKIFAKFFNPIESYYTEYGDGFSSWCRLCIRCANYGITKDHFVKLYNEQGGRCLFCTNGKVYELYSEDLNIDHSHRPYIVRGLLCSRHNLLMSGIDDIDFCSQAIAYRDYYLRLAAEHKVKESMAIEKSAYAIEIENEDIKPKDPGTSDQDIADVLGLSLTRYMSRDSEDR